MWIRLLKPYRVGFIDQHITANNRADNCCLWARQAGNADGQQKWGACRMWKANRKEESIECKQFSISWEKFRKSTIFFCNRQTLKVERSTEGLIGARITGTSGSAGAQMLEQHRPLCTLRRCTEIWASVEISGGKMNMNASHSVFTWITCQDPFSFLRHCHYI